MIALDPIRMRELVLQGPDVTWLVSRGRKGAWVEQRWVVSGAGLRGDGACRTQGRTLLCFDPVPLACTTAWPRVVTTASSAAAQQTRCTAPSDVQSTHVLLQRIGFVLFCYVCCARSVLCCAVLCRFTCTQSSTRSPLPWRRVSMSLLQSEQVLACVDMRLSSTPTAQHTHAVW